MKQLLITCRFVAHSYQGRRSTLGQRDELEWPPSPGRLHQALMSAALTGRSADGPDLRSFLAVLRWMEQLPAPEIVATKLAEAARTRPRVAIPQNNPKGSDFGSHSSLLAPSEKAVAVADELSASYAWPLADPSGEHSADSHIAVLTELAAHVSYLGRAEDRVEISAEIAATDVATQLDSVSFERWQPCDDRGDTELWLPQPNTTDRLIARHGRITNARERRDDAQRYLCLHGYLQRTNEDLLMRWSVAKALDGFDGKMSLSTLADESRAPLSVITFLDSNGERITDDDEFRTYLRGRLAAEFCLPTSRRISLEALGLVRVGYKKDKFAKAAELFARVLPDSLRSQEIPYDFSVTVRYRQVQWSRFESTARLVNICS